MGLKPCECSIDDIKGLPYQGGFFSASHPKQKQKGFKMAT